MPSGGLWFRNSRPGAAPRSLTTARPPIPPIAIRFARPPGIGNGRRRNLRDAAKTRARSVPDRSAAALNRRVPLAQRIGIDLLDEAGAEHSGICELQTETSANGFAPGS